jgi:hypothetical protein
LSNNVTPDQPRKGPTENLDSQLLQSIVIPAHHSFSPENGGFNLDSAGYNKISETSTKSTP